MGYEIVVERASEKRELQQVSQGLGFTYVCARASMCCVCRLCVFMFCVCV